MSDSAAKIFDALLSDDSEKAQAAFKDALGEKLGQAKEVRKVQLAADLVKSKG